MRFLVPVPVSGAGPIGDLNQMRTRRVRDLRASLTDIQRIGSADETAPGFHVAIVRRHRPTS